MYTKEELRNMTRDELIDCILKIQYHMLKISIEIDEITCKSHE